MTSRRERGPSRLPDGGLIDRKAPLRFSFDGVELRGYSGDTLASALLANGISVVGRSFKYHRPRGILSAGAEEPNALVRIGSGDRVEPLARATEVALYEGLAAHSVNCWPSPRFDLHGALDKLHRFLPAGFYYKTFKWPRWDPHSRIVRALAGAGELPDAPDPDWYVKRNAWCDMLVVGSGPAGLAAALAAGRDGASVILLERDQRTGGSALWRKGEIDGVDQRLWAEQSLAELHLMPNVRVIVRTTAFGYYDHNLVAAVERVTDHLDQRSGLETLPRQRLWKIRAREVVLATGAIERPMVFPDNDRPGIMLAGAAHEYLGRFGVRAGSSAVIVTNNDDAYETAFALADAGASALVLDTRGRSASGGADKARKGLEVRFGAEILSVRGVPVRAITFRDESGGPQTHACDLVCMSAGWTPTVHLFSQSGGEVRFDYELQTFVPARAAQTVRCVGSAAGWLTLADCVRSGFETRPSKRDVISPTGYPASKNGSPEASPRPVSMHRADRQWIDFHNDVTVADVQLAARENLVSVEHLKRYTTTGMAIDQGKTSNVNALAHLGIATGRSPGEVGLTKFRPPFVPVSFGVLAGQVVGERFHPLRRLPAHECHVAAGASMTEVSGWLRPEYYPKPGERAEDAIAREAGNVRTKAGLFDSSPLGKIEVTGPDAALLLDRIYDIAPSKLSVVSVAAGLVLNDQGIIVDDGCVARLGQNRFLIVTTTAAAGPVGLMIERYLQVEWSGLEVFVTPVTTQWAMLSVAGPLSREILQALDGSLSIASPEFPNGAAWEGRILDVPVRILRFSFTGELAFELCVPAGQAPRLWKALLSVGAPFGLEPFGIEALDVLRIEKGFIHVGVETDSTTVPGDIREVGAAPSAADHLGKRSLQRTEAHRDGRLQLVGLLANEDSRLPVGAEIAAGAGAVSEGHVTSSIDSPVLGRPIALAMLANGRARHGEVVTVVHRGRTAGATVTSPSFYDPRGARVHA